MEKPRSFTRERRTTLRFFPLHGRFVSPWPSEQTGAFHCPCPKGSSRSRSQISSSEIYSKGIATSIHTLGIKSSGVSLSAAFSLSRLRNSPTSASSSEKTGRHGMASEFQQQILYLYQGMEHMVGLDRTAGSLGASFCPCKDKTGLLYRSLIRPATIPARDSWQSGRKTTKTLSSLSSVST